MATEARTALGAAFSRPVLETAVRCPPSRLTLRALSSSIAVGVTAVAIAVSLSVAWMAVELRGATRVLVESGRARAAADSVQLAALSYRRLADLAVVSGEPEAGAARDAARATMRERLLFLEALATSPEEHRLLRRAGTDTQAWLATRDRLDAAGWPLETIVRRAAPDLQRAVDSLRAVRAYYARRVEESRASALRAAYGGSGIAVGAALLLVLGAVALLWGITRGLARPVRGLHSAIGAFRRGDTEARAPAGGVRELGELSESFNAMADALNAYQAAQLAFLASVVHDLRNPLAALKLAVQALQEDEDAARRARTFALVDRNVDRLSRIVDDLLEATRVEAGGIELRREPVDLRRCAQGVVDLLAHAHPKHPIRFDVEGDPVIVDVDPARLEQILANLIGNAVKFSPAGAPIEVSVLREPSWARVDVTDHGIGIPREQLADIFNPFTRFAPTVAPGVGLGLSVVRRLVEAHGGEVTVRSELGHGSTFSVRLLPAPGPTSEGDRE